MPMKANQIPSPNVVYDKEELRGRLTPVEFQVTQEKHTERPYSNKFYKHREKGTYNCKICGKPLFMSSTKYEAGTGWPSFYDVVDKQSVTYKTDASGVGGNLLLIVSRPDMIRTEVSCRNCGSHLGHVFKDGPKPTGQRYCVNSSSLDFEAAAALDEADSTTTTTSTSSSVTKEEEETLVFAATLGGCDGPGGTCSLRARKEVQKRLEELSLKNGDDGGTTVAAATKDTASKSAAAAATEEASKSSSSNGDDAVVSNGASASNGGGGGGVQESAAAADSVR